MLYLPRTTLLASLGLAVVGVTAFAQEAIWVRGTVERVEQPKLFVKTKYGAPVRLVAGDSPQLIAAVKSSIAEVRPGMFVRAVEKPHSPDIRQIAELHIFPDFMQHADSLRVPMFLGRQVTSMWAFAMTQGEGPKDYTNLMKHIERWAGTEVRGKAAKG